MIERTDRAPTVDRTCAGMMKKMEMEMEMKGLVGDGKRRMGLAAFLVAALTILVNTAFVAGSISGATSQSEINSVVAYAAATASHARPVSVVTESDVSNAIGTPLVNTGNVSIGFNLGEVAAFPRLALFVTGQPTSQVCVDFPAIPSGRPEVVNCPLRAVLLWQYAPFLVDIARNAVARAARNGTAVSGADVPRETAGSGWTLVPRPTFKSGSGGVATFSRVIAVGASKVRITVCVIFPKMAFGIPHQTPC